MFVSSIADLSKHKRYEIRLSVYNAVGEGPISTPQEVFVGEAGEHLSRQTRTLFSLITTTAMNIHVSQSFFPTVPVLSLILTLYSLVPTAPPQNVAVQSSTATQLDVTWDPPPLEAQNGDIQGYKVAAILIPAADFHDLASTSFNNFFSSGVLLWENDDLATSSFDIFSSATLFTHLSFAFKTVFQTHIIIQYNRSLSQYSGGVKLESIPFCVFVGFCAFSLF